MKPTAFRYLAATTTAAALGLANAPALAAPRPPASVQDHFADTGAIKVHYLREGSGETLIVLLHGWPESSREWRKVMPILAERFTVVAPDLRGIGQTDAPADGYDKATMARDLHGLIGALKPKRVVVVGHDIGGMVAYAYARLYPEEARGVAILDVPLPGVAPWEQIKTDPRAWHFGFNVQAPLAEQLVTGRETVFVKYFIRKLGAAPSAVSDKEIADYAKAYGTPPRLHAGFGFYRAFPADEAFTKLHAGPLSTPLLLAGAERSAGPLLPPIVAGLKALGATNVRTAVIADSGHFVADEQPAATAKVVADFADSVTGGPDR